MKFRDLKLTEPILRALSEQGYTDPTPIQAKAIPPALAGRDVLGCAQTGTGKTCAFAAPVLQNLAGRPGCGGIRALVLAPTRELAIQDGECFAQYGKYLPLRSAVIFGGVGQAPQVQALQQGVDILTATPGRLLDLQGQGHIDLSAVEIFVLDEADRMLDMGFIHDVRRVLKLLPQKKQTMLFSATMPPEVMALVEQLLKNPVRVEAAPVSSPVEAIDQSLYFAEKGEKTRLLAYLLRSLQVKNALVFTRTKHGANKVAKELNAAGISAAAIHGNKSQTARQQALADFKAGQLRVLVATDIAARGLDISALSHVFNYNLPEVPETYIHRIGRTGRAGLGGTAIAFCAADETEYLRGIEKLLGRKLPRQELPPAGVLAEQLRPAEPPAELPARVKPAGQEKKPAKASRQAPQPGGQVTAEKPEKASKTAKRAEKVSEKQEIAAQKQAKAPKKQAKSAESAQKQPSRRQDRSVQAQLSAQEGKSLLPEQKTRPERPYVRPERRLFSPDELTPAEANTEVFEFYKPNPLDGDVIMDATARLLSRRSGAPEPRPEGKQKQAEQKSRPAKPAKRSAQEPAIQPDSRNQPPEAAGESGGKSRRRRRRGGKSSAGAQSAAPRSAPEKSVPAQAEPSAARKPAQSPERTAAQNPERTARRHKKQKTPKTPETRQAEPAASAMEILSAGRKRRRRSRPQEVEMRQSSQKDSTEQESLMKPYYIEHD